MTDEKTEKERKREREKERKREREIWKEKINVWVGRVRVRMTNEERQNYR